MSNEPQLDILLLYDGFDLPVTSLDCGTKCAPHNPSGKPFCCDICHAVPAVYRQEWAYLARRTDLWHVWRGDECTADPADPAELLADTPETMLLLACLGPAHCQRPYRAMSCRQFPFFPYITSKREFVGLAYDWESEGVCWVISNLAQVTLSYRQAFVHTYDRLFSLWEDEFESYANLSLQMREHFARQRRRIPLLHRDGSTRLISPRSERTQRVAAEHLPRHGVYRS